MEQLFERELQTVDTQEAHEKEKERLESVNADLRTICTELEVKYEKKRLELLVDEVKRMQEEVLTVLGLG